MFVFTAFFRFLNHILNLKALDQPQSASEESLLTRDIKYLFVQCFVYAFHQNRKKLMLFQNKFWNRKYVINQFKQRKKLFCCVIVNNYFYNDFAFK